MNPCLRNVATCCLRALAPLIFVARGWRRWQDHAFNSQILGYELWSGSASWLLICTWLDGLGGAGIKHRLDLLRKWRSWAVELAPAEERLRSSMDATVSNVLGSKRLCLLRRIAESISWTDMKVLDELEKGFRIVGHGTKSGLFRPGVKLAQWSEDRLMEEAPALREELLRKVGLERPSPLAKELHDVTSKEAREKGWLKGPLSTEEVDKAFGNWLPVRRFPVEQKDKVRPIDDYKENGLNKAYTAVEKITLSAMDHMLWSLQTLLKFFTAKGDVALTLSTGEVLSGRVHPDWKLGKGSILVTAIDLRSAYKQLPLSPKDYDKTILVCKHPVSGKVQCYSTLTLPFGACASVDCFLRVSALLHAIGCELALLWTNYFDDFPLLASHSLVSTSSLAAAKAFLTLVGFQWADDKLLPFSSACDVLGVRLDLSEAEHGLIRVSNKCSRVEEVMDLLGRASFTKSLVPSNVPSFIGKMQYADCQVWGRAGKIALADLRDLGGTSRSPVTLSDSHLEALAVRRFSQGRPVTLKASETVRPHVIFCDGALEGGEAAIGGVLLPPCEEMPCEVFGGALPREIFDLLTGSKTHAIGAVELYASVVALSHWMKRIEGGRTLLFVDNWPALDALVKGTSGVAEWRSVLLALERAESGSPPLLWVARVPSGSNIADDPSRGSLKVLNNLEHITTRPVCPITQQVLPSFFA